MFFSRHKQGWIPYHIQFIFSILLFEVRFEISKVLIYTYVPFVTLTKRKNSKIQTCYAISKDTRKLEFPPYTVLARKFTVKKMVSMVFMARLDGLRFCSVVACITFYQCYKRNRESILRTERRLAFAIFNTNFPMHFSVFLRIFNTGVQTEPWSKYWGINNFRPENDAVFSNCHVEGIINSSM